MLNTSEDVPLSTRCNIIDLFAPKLLNSGHSIKEVKRNILSGLKGYLKRRRQCFESGSQPNRSAKDSSVSRRWRKLTGMSNWFRSKKPELASPEKQ